MSLPLLHFGAPKLYDPADGPRELDEAQKKAIRNVPPDGSCLYHCIVRLLELSTWHEQHGVYKNAQDLREALAKYFLDKGEKYNFDEYSLDVRRAFNSDNPQFVTFEDAMPAYAKTIRGTQWGGDLELNMLSEMLDVVIHRFDSYDYTIQKARLVTTFFPTDDVSDTTPNKTRWVVVYHRNHFQFVEPNDPRKPAGTSRSGAVIDRAVEILKERQSERSGEMTARERADFLKTMRNKRQIGPPKPVGPSLLRELAREREAREARKNPEACFPAVKELTKEQQEEMQSIELARRLERMYQAEDEQVERDRAYAKSMS